MTKLISTNPSRNYEKVGSVTISSLAEIKQKVVAARKAAPRWKSLPLIKRLAYFSKLRVVYRRHSQEMAELVSREMGKSIGESAADVTGDLENISNKIELAQQYLAPVILDKTKTMKNVLYFEPHGVVAAIVPWNFPSSNFFITCLPILMSGNTVVFKHSEECPLVGKLFEKILREAGFPEGVFAVVHGDGKVGDMLTDQAIDAIHFTGSSKIGEFLYQKAAKKFIPVVLEMGGSSPGIIFADADLDTACKQTFVERFGNCGQVCNALKRLFVHKSIFAEVVERMKIMAENMRVGDALDYSTQCGPLVAKRQQKLLQEQVQDAVDKGAKVVAGGSVPKGLQGAYYLPTILTKVTPKMRVMSEEVFGPVLPITPFTTEAEAIMLANNTIYGLSAYVYGGNITQLKVVAAQIEAGQISINGQSFFSKHAPFGGYKKSGLGRNDGYFGFDAATQKKVVAEPI